MNKGTSGKLLILVCFVLSFFFYLFAFSSSTLAATGINQRIHFQGKVVKADGTSVTDGTYNFAFTMYDGAGSGATTLFTETWTVSSLFSATMSSAPGLNGESLTYTGDANESTLKVGQILWNVTKQEPVTIVAVNTGTNSITISPTRQAWANSDTLTNAVYVKDGVFFVDLNSLNDSLAGVDFNTDNIYLGVNYAGDGEMKPRIRFTSSPYAMNALSVTGLTIPTGATVAFSGANSLTLTTGGTTNATLPSGTITLTDTTTTQTLTNKTIGSTGLVFNGAATDISTVSNEHLVIIPNGTGNVGIGTTSPSNVLSIQRDQDATSSIGIYNNSNTANGLSTLVVSESGTVGGFSASAPNYGVSHLAGRLSFGASAGGGIDIMALTASGDLRFYTAGALTTNERLRIDSSGNVGIGITNPTQKLDVLGNATVSGNLAMGGQLQVGRSGADPAQLGVGSMYYNTTNNKFRCYINNAWADCDTSGGSGLWSAIQAPTGNLSLAMSTYTSAFNWSTGTSSNDLFSLTTDSSANGTGSLLNLQTGTSSTVLPLRVRAGSVEGIMVNAAGNVGIGTTGQGAKLELNSGTSGVSGLRFTQLTSASTPVATNTYVLSVDSSGNVTLTTDQTGGGSLPAGATGNTLYYNGSTWAASGNIYNNNGNVGIGTTGPTAKLDVSGNLNVTGYATTSASLSVGSYGALGGVGNAVFSGLLGIGTATPARKLDVSSTTSFASLGYFEWSPGSTTISASDLFSLNIGPNGLIGNIFNAMDNGGSVFGISQSAITANLPANFTAEGDVGVAYDLYFSNTTASFVKSSAPLYLVAGEAYGSSNLTLRTYNAGNVVIDSHAYISNSTVTGKALIIADQLENQDIFTASSSGVTKFTIASTGSATASGNLTMGGQLQVGRFSVDPAALGAGALYFNTTSNSVLLYNGSTWGALAGGSSSWSGLTAPTSALTMNMYQVVGTSFATTLTYGNATSTTNLFNITDTNSNSGTGYMFNLTTGTSSTLKPFHVAAAGVEAILVNAAGNIGIGTVTPLEKLSLTGNATVSGNLTFNGAASSIQNTSMQALTIGGTTTGLVSFQSQGTGAGRVQIGSGNAGSATPDILALDVKSTTGDTGVLAFNGAMYYNAADNAFRCYQNNAWTNCVSAGGSMSIGGAITSGTTGSVLFVNSSNQLAQDNGNFFWDAGNARLGIGKTTPATALDVSGTVTATAFSGNGSALTGIAGATGGITNTVNTNIIADNDSNGSGQITFTIGSTDRLVVANSGNIGIGSSSPIEKLDITGNATVSGNITLGNGSSIKSAYGPLKLSYKSAPNTWATGLTIQDSTGNIGIGTANPLEKLHISGGNVLIDQRTNTSNEADMSWTNISGTVGQIGSNGTAFASASAMVNYNGIVFVGTARAYGSANGAGGAVYQYNPNSGTWTSLTGATPGTWNGGTANVEGISSMAVYNGKLYVGTNNQTSGTEIYRWDGSTNWTRVSGATPGTINGCSPTGTTGATNATTAMAVYNGKLYVGTAENSRAYICRYDGGTTWVNVGNGTAGTILNGSTSAIDAITSMGVWNQQLWVGTQKGTAAGELYVYRSGTGATAASWVIIGTATLLGAPKSVSSMAVWNGKLYVGTTHATAGNVYRIESVGSAVGVTPTNSQLVAAGQFLTTTGIIGVPAMTTYKGKLYAGTYKAGQAEIYRYDADTRWTKVSWGAAGQISNLGTPTTGIDGIAAMMQYNDKLYVSDFEAGSAEIFSYSTVTDESYALEFHAGSSLVGEQNGLLNDAEIYFTASSSAAYYTGVQGTTGNFVFSHSILTSFGAYDVAEDYPSRDETLEPGDVISIDPNERGFVRRSTTPYDKTIVGVFSENPGLRLSQKDGTIDGGNVLPVALAGRVPVKVSTENGPIQSGDTLTTSSIPGVAMKATKTGSSLGRAMEPYNGEGVGKVLVFVNMSSYIADDSNTIDFASGSASLVLDTLTAKTIKADSIEGLEIMTNKISNLAVSNGIGELKDDVALLHTKVASIEAQLSTPNSTDSAQTNLRDSQDSNIISSATGLTLLGKTTAYGLNIIDKLTLGLLTVENDASASASIQTTLAPLKLQKDALGNLEIMGSSIVIDTAGNMLVKETITAKELRTNRLSILDEKDASNGAVLAASSGRAQIAIGETFTLVNTATLSDRSLIFATPEEHPIAVSAKKQTDHTIKISINNPLSEILTVDWWIIN